MVCEFVIPNFDFRNYVNDNKVAIKQAPITLKVVDEEKLQIAKDTINIAVRAIEEERSTKRTSSPKTQRKSKTGGCCVRGIRGIIIVHISHVSDLTVKSVADRLRTFFFLSVALSLTIHLVHCVQRKKTKAVIDFTL